MTGRKRIWTHIWVTLVFRPCNGPTLFTKAIQQNSSFCCCSVTKSRLTLRLHGCSMPGSPVLNYLPEFASVHVHWAGDAISSSAAVFSFCLQSFPATESFPMSWLFKQQVAKVLELQLQHQSFQWIVRLISFRIDWFELLAVQGTLKSLLQHHSSKVPIL